MNNFHPIHLKTLHLKPLFRVLILPHGFDPLEEHDIVTYWVAKIKDIRAEKFMDGSNAVRLFSPSCIGYTDIR